jgi:hypothetical protein
MSTSRLTITGSFRSGGVLMAECICECGQQKVARMSSVKRGDVKSCGCLRREKAAENGRANTRHGHSSPASRSHTYRSWETMKSRCLNISDPSFADYGGRGIGVCDRWLDFENFLTDMGERPRATTLDRIDVNGDYNPGNCRWSDARTQGRNRRNNRLVEFNGELIPLVVLSEQTGVPYQRLHERIVRRNWTVEDAIRIPPRGFV